MSKFVSAKVASKKMQKKLRELGRNGQRFANAANYEFARKNVFKDAVYRYAPHSAAFQYGLKSWGYRLTDEASLSPNRVGKMVEAIILFNAPQSLYLHELGGNPFSTRPGSTPDYLRIPMDKAEGEYLREVGRIIDRYLSGEKPRNITTLNGNRGRP